MTIEALHVGRFLVIHQETIITRLGSSRPGPPGAEEWHRLAVDGPNTAADRLKPEIAAKVLRRLVEPLVAILLVAALMSGLTGDWPGFAVIVCIVIMSVGLEVLREHRVELAAERLRDSVALKASVRQRGHAVMLPVERVVSGDVVGSADGRRVSAWKPARPHPALVTLALALGPLAPMLGFAPLPSALLTVIATLAVGHLVAAEVLIRLAIRADQP